LQVFVPDIGTEGLGEDCTGNRPVVGRTGDGPLAHNF